MNKSKIFMITSIIVLLVTILGSAATYAWYYWSTTDTQKTTIVTNVGAATIYYNAGTDISSSLIPVEDKANGAVKTIEVKSTTEDALTFNLYLDITSLDEGLKDESFRYQIYRGEELSGEGNFSQTYLDSNTEDCQTNTSVKHLTLLENESITTTVTTYTLYIWIDGTMSNPNTMQNKNYEFKLHAEGEYAIIKEGIIPEINDIPTDQQNTFAYKILSDYYYAEKSEITNNSIKYYYDTKHSLMSDIAGNVRYYGKSPNNYVYFNCDDYNSPTSETCELWRVIGVFDGKVKIIRSTFLGSYSFDYDYNDDGSSTTYSNDWSKASLNTLLNGAYYNNEDTTYYNGSTTATEVNFSTDGTGIKNDETRNMISEHLWNIGGSPKPGGLYSDQIYEYERGTSVYSGNAITWRGKIAIMYVSDYGYGADFGKCSVNLGSYNNGTCTSTNWHFVWNKNSLWILLNNKGTSNKLWHISLMNGNIGIFDGNGYPATEAYLVYPTLYLDPNVTSISGTGTSTDPYILSL